MKIKKYMSLIVVVLLVFLSGCTQSSRFGMQELARRIGIENEKYAFTAEGAFLSDGYWHIPFSCVQADDLLLSCKEDTNGNLLQILLTAEKDTAPAADFIAFSKVLTKVFFGVSDYQAAAIAENAGLTDESVLFTDHTDTQTHGRYSFTFFSTPVSVTVILTYDDAVVVAESANY